MKSFIFSIIIAAIIVSGSLIYTNYIDGLSEDMCGYNNEIKELIANNEYEKAGEAVNLLSDFIERKKLALASTMDHNNIDSIERNIAELSVYTKEGQKFDALAKCEVLSVLFEHLPKNYNVVLENIL